MSDSHAIRIFVSALTGAFFLRKARDAVLLPPSKGSVKGLHRSTEQSLAMDGILERPEGLGKMSVPKIRIL